MQIACRKPDVQTCFMIFSGSPVKISDTTQKLGTDQFFHIPFTPLLIIKFKSAEPKLSNFVRIKNFFHKHTNHAVQANIQKLQRKLRAISCTYPFFNQSYKHSSLGVKVHDPLWRLCVPDSSINSLFFF